MQSAPHSLNAMSRDEMICACRSMATKELALAQSAPTRSGRVDHVYNAASWSERADLLQRIEDSCKQSPALSCATSEKEMRDGGK
jgi:hypothetical protein